MGKLYEDGRPTTFSSEMGINVDEFVVEREALVGNIGTWWLIHYHMIENMVSPLVINELGGRKRR